MNDLYNREAEMRVIGSLMLYSDSLADTALDLIGADSEPFFIESHKLIYNAIMRLHLEGVGLIDPSLVSEELDKKHQLNRAGGDMFLYDLQKRIPTEGDCQLNFEKYCSLIHEYHIRRKYRQMFQKGIEQTEALEETIFDIAQSTTEWGAQLASQINITELPLITSTEIHNLEIEPVEEIVPGIIPKGLILLAGEPYAGKSLVALNLALAAALGGKAWGEIDIIDPINTLFLAYESTYQETVEREQLMLSGEPAPNNLFYHIMESEMDLRLDPEGVEKLRKTIQMHDIGLVIVDTWQQAMPIHILKGNMNAYQQDHTLLAPIQRLAKMLNISVVLLHHTGKVKSKNGWDDIIGSRAMRSVPDCNIILRGTVEDPDPQSFEVQNRHSKPQVYTMDINFSSPGICQLNNHDYSDLNDTQKAIWNAFENDSEVLSPVEISQRTKIKNVKMAIRRMDGEQLERVEVGKYKRKYG